MDRRDRRIVFFYSNALPEAVRVRRGIVTDSPAATRKILAMGRALRTAGARAIVVSMARGPGRGGRFHRGGITRVGGVPVVYGPLWDVPVASQLLSALWLAWFAWRVAHRSRGVRHLFYNQMSLYLPALHALTLRRAAISVDIEDGPLSASEAAYSRRGTDASAAFARYATHGAILATTRLAQGTPIRPVQTCYGAVPEPVAIRPERFADGPLCVMLAGFINQDTGQTQFEAALEQMRALRDPAFDQLRFEIAGAGPGIDALRRFEDGACPDVRIHGRLDAAGYAALLGRAHVGLSLKPVGGGVSETTFPSKTVEIAENGLALIATDISDVKAVFGDAAWYLETTDPNELVACIRRAATDRATVLQLAMAGQRRMIENLSYHAVGRTLSNFLYGGTA
ncbi:glycosyltransferase family protein [Sphingomonas sp. DC2100-1]|uniref:glycosyltransferase family protein n=2 Tax=unclassified Sphingomonas TaxID=196159 RepID=UPI003CF28059